MVSMLVTLSREKREREKKRWNLLVRFLVFGLIDECWVCGFERGERGLFFGIRGLLHCWFERGLGGWVRNS